MADDAPDLPNAAVPAEPDAGAPDDKKKRKKAEKARSAWISFAGRIIAQIVGAAASVLLGLYVLQRAQQPAPAPSTGDAASTGAGAPAAPTRPTARRPGPATIAVLPLANLSNDPRQEYFVDGMAEALTASLARVEGLRVISRTSTLRYKVNPPPVPEIARALGADLVVEGSVLQADGAVRITAQLIDGGTDEHLWAESYTRPLKDVIALQDAVATAIATAIKGTVSRTPGSRPATEHVVDAATYDLYLRGRHAWYTRTPDGLRTALAFFEKAAAKDPEFALAHVGIADTYALQSSPSMGLDEVRDRMARAKAAAIRALDLDDSLAEAHTALGGVIFFGERNLPDAEMKFRRAIELNPNYPVAHEWLGLLLGEMGRTDEALRHAGIAVTLDPFEATMYQARGLVQYHARRFDEAAASERKALELSPQLPLARALLVKALLMGERSAETAAVCAEAGDAASNLDLRIACLVAAVKGQRASEAATRRRTLEAARPAPGPALAQVEAAVGEYDAAFARLDRLAARGNLPPVLFTDPLFDGLRAQARWQAAVAMQRAHDAAGR